MEDKITLDRKTFKALAADTRIDILKELAKRRKTQSELAKSLSMSNSTIKEHLDNLESVGLVVQIDEGYKWKYYELTRKGKKIVTPEETRIWITLGISVLALAAALKNFLPKLMPTRAEDQILAVRSLADYANGAAEESAPAIAEHASKAADDLIIEAQPWYAQYIQSPYTDLALVIIIAIILGIAIGWLIKSRR